jgi:hypothetical protein
MDQQQEYLRRAEDCMMLMRIMSSVADRRAMRAAADRWRALAAAAIRKESAHGPSQPANPATRGLSPAGSAGRDDTPPGHASGQWGERALRSAIQTA